MLSDLIQKPRLKELIEKEDFQTLYQAVDQSTLDSEALSAMTEEWLDLGINPLDYMTALPGRYLTGQVKYKSVLIPKNIINIKYGALSETQGLEEICYQGTIEEFESVNKELHWMPPHLVGVQCFDGVWLSAKNVNTSCSSTASSGAATTISGTTLYMGSGESLPDPKDSSSGDIFLKQVPAGVSELWMFVNDQWQMLSTPSLSIDTIVTTVAQGSGLRYTPSPTITWSGKL